MWGNSLAIAMDRVEVLEQLKALKQDNYTSLRRLDQQMRGLLSNQKNLKPQGSTPSLSIQAFKSFESEMEVLMTRKKEHLLRQSFLDRLLFQVDNKYKGKDLRNFLHHTLMEMSLTETTSPHGEAQLWRFLTYLSLAIKIFPEPNENLLSFLEGYMNFSTIAHPTKLDQFIKLRHYTNGTSNFPARPMEVEKVGEAVEEKLLQLEKKKDLSQTHKKFKK